MMIFPRPFVLLGTIILISLSIGLANGYDYYQPEQIHIAFGSKPNDIMVTWTTFDDTDESRVQYGEGDMDKEAVGTSTRFTDGGPLNRTMYIHRTLLPDLKFDTKYVYHVGSDQGWSELFSFKTPPEGEDWMIRAAVYGDMGNVNARSMSYLQDEAERGHFDLILHVGDFAYDMDSDNALVGDQFMRQIQPLAAGVPYMTCPGNHEEAYNFSNYKNRFSMPGDRDSMFYSFDLGPVHFVSINTEVYYFFGKYGGLQLIDNQFNWLKEDLTNATQPENRHKYPWIIMFGHRPMYCSNSGDDCWNKDLPNRVGVEGHGGLEPLLKEFGVDLVVWAHEHSYERTWPLYDQKVYNGTDGAYINPGAPVHIVTGSAGCQEGSDKFKNNTAAWSAFRSDHYGYTRMFVHNKTHIHLQQVDVERHGEIIDDFWIVRERHEPYDL